MRTAKPRGIPMSAIPYDSQGQDSEPPELDSFDVPGRRRRRLFNRKSAPLAAAITCAAGFYAGVRVEKSQLGGTATAATTAASSARAGATAPGFGGTGGVPAPASRPQ